MPYNDAESSSRSAVRMKCASRVFSLHLRVGEGRGNGELGAKKGIRVSGGREGALVSAGLLELTKGMAEEMGLLCTEKGWKI